MDRARELVVALLAGGGERQHPVRRLTECQRAVYRTLGLGILLAFGLIGLFVGPVVLALLVVWVADSDGRAG